MRIVQSTLPISYPFRAASPPRGAAEFRVDARIVGRRVGKVLPDVAQRGRSQQCVAYGVDRHVAVRVGHETFRVRNLHPSQHQPQSAGQRMDIVSVSDSVIHRCSSVFLLPKLGKSLFLQTRSCNNVPTARNPVFFGVPAGVLPGASGRLRGCAPRREHRTCNDGRGVRRNA